MLTICKIGLGEIYLVVCYLQQKIEIALYQGVSESAETYLSTHAIQNIEILRTDRQFHNCHICIERGCKHPTENAWSNCCCDSLIKILESLLDYHVNEL